MQNPDFGIPSTETLETLNQEKIELSPHHSSWFKLFKSEKELLTKIFPKDELLCIEHIGSTAIKNIMAKPIVDILAIVKNIEKIRLEHRDNFINLGYEFYWRPLGPGKNAQYYGWLIKRNDVGQRIIHLHIFSPSYDWKTPIQFRDYLNAHPQIAKEYETLKINLQATHTNDRQSYYTGKTSFIQKINSICIE